MVFGDENNLDSEGQRPVNYSGVHDTSNGIAATSMCDGPTTLCQKHHFDVKANSNWFVSVGPVSTEHYRFKTQPTQYLLPLALTYLVR